MNPTSGPQNPSHRHGGGPEGRSESAQLLHDLRQPLGAMMNRLALLGTETLSSRGRQQLSALQSEVEMLARELERRLGPRPRD